MPQTPQISWVALVGEAQFSRDSITFSPSASRAVEAEQGPLPKRASGAFSSYCELRSSAYFTEGLIHFELKLDAPESRCQVILNSGWSPEIFVGFNNNVAAYVISSLERQEGNKTPWTTFASAKEGGHPDGGRWLKVEIRVTGSYVTLFVDGVLVVASQVPTLFQSQVGLYMAGDKSVHVRNFKVSTRAPKVFVIMQFTDEFNALYKEVIVPCCDSFGCEAERGDDIYNNGLIITDIENKIQSASVVIADITPNNPNVYYEVGFAHALKKPTILMCDGNRQGGLPFDVSGFRTLFYENTIAGKVGVENRLRMHLQQIVGGLSL